jgi:phosphopentomutase
MAKAKNPHGVGFRKPPRKTRFKKGRSGNPKGRPKGTKNFNTVLEKELEDKIAVSENGEQKKISKLQVVVKQLVKKAAAGDARAMDTLIKHIRQDDSASVSVDDLQIFDTADHRNVMTGVVRRIRSMEEPVLESQNSERSA